MAPGYFREHLPPSGAPKVSTLTLPRVQGALQYLASPAWGKASEWAWLVWWWSPEGCQSNQPDQSLLQERKDH